MGWVKVKEMREKGGEGRVVSIYYCFVKEIRLSVSLTGERVGVRPN